ncbi:PTS sugar transporter subunit IIA [Enterococcus faecalis]
MSKRSFYVLITSHDTLCQAYLNAARLILCEELENVYTVAFSENMPTEYFQEEVAKIVQTCQARPLLILSDVIGGTPNNIAMKYLMEKDIHLITGINLPLLLEVLLAQTSGVELATLNLKELVSKAQSNLVYVNALIQC